MTRSHTTHAAPANIIIIAKSTMGGDGSKLNAEMEKVGVFEA